MDKKNITILTGTGGILGTGHMQRMLNLAVYLNKSDNFSAKLFLTQNEYPLPAQFTELLIHAIPSNTDLIIRDLRDSSADEIQSLQQIATVLAIDDSGPGREYADYTVSLLPIPSESFKTIKPETSLFLYGYNFTEGIDNIITNVSLKKNLDIAVYAGYDPSPELIRSIRRSIPGTADSILLAKGETINLTGNFAASEISYSEIIARAKIVITHFGLTMFEADVCGCRIAALNPTEYHSLLTGTIRHDFKVIYSAEYNSLSADVLYNIIHNELNKTDDQYALPSEILKKINSGTENFLKFIEKICFNPVSHIVKLQD